jgi:hypothetical protein
MVSLTECFMTTAEAQDYSATLGLGVVAAITDAVVNPEARSDRRSNARARPQRALSTVESSLALWFRFTATGELLDAIVGITPLSQLEDSDAQVRRVQTRGSPKTEAGLSPEKRTLIYTLKYRASGTAPEE